jgi:hypothetical protein
MPIKTLIIATLITLYFVPLALEAKVYKCKNENGKVVYSSKKCDVKSQTQMKSPVKSTEANASLIPDSPVGSWVNEKNAKMTASISSSGGFQMTDFTGVSISGSWAKDDKGKYSLDASFQGLDMGLRMKYSVAADELFLSKPGFVGTLVKYKRNN